jgi:Ion transport protein
MDSTGAVKERLWLNADFNFDNLLNAQLALFVTITQDGYTDIMADAMAAPAEKGMQPQVWLTPDWRDGPINSWTCVQVDD